MSGTSMINGHVDPDPIFVIYDVEGSHNPPVYGVFTTYGKAQSALSTLVNDFVDKCLAEPAEETGLTEDDREWLIQDTQKAFAIQRINEGIDTFKGHSDIISSYV